MQSDCAAVELTVQRVFAFSRAVSMLCAVAARALPTCVTRMVPSAAFSLWKASISLRG